MVKVKHKKKLTLAAGNGKLLIFEGKCMLLRSLQTVHEVLETDGALLGSSIRAGEERLAAVGTDASPNNAVGAGLIRRLSPALPYV
jgi:hypothetical protein